MLFVRTAQRDMQMQTSWKESWAESKTGMEATVSLAEVNTADSVKYKSINSLCQEETN